MFNFLFSKPAKESEALRNARARQAARQTMADMKAEPRHAEARASDFQFATFGK